MSLKIYFSYHPAGPPDASTLGEHICAMQLLFAAAKIALSKQIANLEPLTATLAVLKIEPKLIGINFVCT